MAREIVGDQIDPGKVGKYPEAKGVAPSSRSLIPALALTGLGLMSAACTAPISAGSPEAVVSPAVMEASSFTDLLQKSIAKDGGTIVPTEPLLFQDATNIQNKDPKKVPTTVFVDYVVQDQKGRLIPKVMVAQQETDGVLVMPTECKSAPVYSDKDKKTMSATEITFVKSDGTVFFTVRFDFRQPIPVGTPAEKLSSFISKETEIDSKGRKSETLYGPVPTQDTKQQVANKPPGMALIRYATPTPEAVRLQPTVLVPTPQSVRRADSAPTVSPTQAPTLAPTEASNPTATATTAATEAPATATVAPTSAPTEAPISTATPSVELLPVTQKAVGEFVTAMKNAGVPLTSEQVLKGLTTNEITGKDGKKYQVASTSDGYPLMIKEAGGDWKKVDQRNSDLVTGQITGALLEGYRLADPAYVSALKEYGSVIISTDLQWKYIFANKDGQDFSYLQGTTLPYLSKNGVNLGVVNSLAWGNPETLPEWLLKGNFSKQELITILKSNVTSLAKFLASYNPKIVVGANEVFGNMQNKDFWSEKIGREEYLKIVFQTARANLPQGTRLAVNDFGNNYAEDPKSENLFNLVKKLNDQEMAITGHKLIDEVGMQSPLAYLSAGELALLKPDTPQYNSLIKKFTDMITRYRAIGVDVVITENFVDQRKLGLTSEERNLNQAKIYGEFAKICYELGVPYYIYGPKDDDKAYPEGLGDKYKDADPYLVGSDGKDKLARHAVLKAKFGAIPQK